MEMGGKLKPTLAPLWVRGPLLGRNRLLDMG